MPLKAHFCYLNGSAFRCLLESRLILNLLTRMSSLVAPDEKSGPPINNVTKLQATM